MNEGTGLPRQVIILKINTPFTHKKPLFVAKADDKLKITTLTKTRLCET